MLTHERRHLINSLQRAIDHCAEIGDMISVSLEAAQEILSEMKKRDPTPPIVKTNENGCHFFYCPTCNKEIDFGYLINIRLPSYCEDCGQAIKPIKKGDQK